MSQRPFHAAAFVACLGLANVCAATPPPVPADGPPPPLASAEQGTHVAGLVSRFLVNPNGDVDGMLLDGQTQVTFSPPMGNALSRKAKTGDRVAVDGFRISTLPLVRAASIALPDGERLTDAPPVTPVVPPPPPPLQPMDAAGHVVQPLY